jgi:uncharacterized protein YjeT (DUF2065 family)
LINKVLEDIWPIAVSMLLVSSGLLLEVSEKATKKMIVIKSQGIFATTGQHQ